MIPRSQTQEIRATIGQFRAAGVLCEWLAMCLKLALSSRSTEARPAGVSRSNDIPMVLATELELVTRVCGLWLNGEGVTQSNRLV